MRISFARNLATFAAALPLAVMMIGAAPSFADEIKTDTMAAEPMKTDPMATNTMSADPMAADPMKADCMKKAEMETDAMKRQTMTAECDTIAGGAMQADPMAADQMAPKQWQLHMFASGLARRPAALHSRHTNGARRGKPRQGSPSAGRAPQVQCLIRDGALT